jgi:hypothetical protein
MRTRYWKRLKIKIDGGIPRWTAQAAVMRMHQYFDEFFSGTFCPIRLIRTGQRDNLVRKYVKRASRMPVLIGTTGKGKGINAHHVLKGGFEHDTIAFSVHCGTGDGLRNRCQRAPGFRQV